MAPMPVPPADGGDDDPVSGLQQGLRLSDVEVIAARRLDGAAEGSLGEALAIAAAANAGDAAPQMEDDGEPLFMPTEDRQGVLAAPPAAPAMARSLEEATAAQSIEPLTNALDAAVRLAADASVAAEALENLKRLLERKQQLESQLPHLAAASQPTSA